MKNALHLGNHHLFPWEALVVQLDALTEELPAGTCWVCDSAAPPTPGWEAAS